MSEPENAATNNVSELLAEAKNEPIASFLNLQLLELQPGYAKVMLKVLPEYENFNGVTFGGITMAVADQAFGYAVNSVNRPNVASQFNIHFIAPARAGDELIAEGRVVKSGRRVSIAEMTVTNQDGKLIAKATGTTIPLTSTHSRSTDP
ncbi:MAG: PaaI family thioesterase [Dehalococcoidia bacterium]|nr:PaaI family thioesterase [Dehalococcoidia bacterium]